MYRAIAGIVVVVLLAGCGAAPVGSTLPATGDDNPPLSRCWTSYFNADRGVGFDLPEGLTGPVIDERFGLWWAEWSWPGDDLSAIRLSKGSSSLTVEQLAASWSQGPGVAMVLRNEPLLTNSGQKAWLIVRTLKDYPNEITFVNVFLVRNGAFYSLNMTGRIEDGTNDVDYLLGVCRTLCAE